MKRREFMALLGGAAIWPVLTHAQQAGKVPKIGYLSSGSASAGLARDDAFRQGLRELGYVERTNIVIEHRFAEGNFNLLPQLAAELVRLKVDVIVAVLTQASLAARDATRTMPIVMVAVSDPVESGLVASLARPGANVTGTSSMTTEVVGKSLGVLKEVIPRIARVAVLRNPSNVVFQAQILREMQIAAAALGIELETFGVRGPDDFEAAFAGITRAHTDALLVLGDPMLIDHRARIVAFAEKSRLPAMYTQRENATAGGLITYGTDFLHLYRRAAAYVDRILKGAQPADLPVEQPTRFELVINLKTAKALGLELPPTLLARADEVIE